MNFAIVSRWAGAILIAVVALGLIFGWNVFEPDDVPEGFARSNGRIQAVEIDIAPTLPGRVLDVLVRQGDFLEAGQLVARMDSARLKALLREAEARSVRATIGIGAAKNLVEQRKAEKLAALAVVQQRKAEQDAARNQRDRSEELATAGNTSQQRLDEDRARYFGSQAAVSAARAQVAAVEAALNYAGSQVVGAESDVEAAKAVVQRIRADLEDSDLTAPRAGRVQYIVAQSGEILPPGGAILSMVDLSDVYMVFFLPTSAAGRIGIETEVRLVLDAAPEFVIPAKVSFVADVAQFTPKTVETEEERQKLMFQVRARIAPDLLKQYLNYVKTGLPGLAYVRTDATVDWPETLQVRLPQ